MLTYIDPAKCSYQEWIDVGMAIKAEGLSCDVWDAWSAKDDRYKPGECWTKWDGFHGTGVTGATITHMAKEGGWASKMKSNPYQYDGYEIIGMDDEVAPKDWLPTVDPTKPMFADPARQALEFIKMNFRPGDQINIVTGAMYLEEKQKWVPANKGFTYPYEYIVKAIENGMDAFIGDRNKEAGVWIRTNPMDGQGVKNDNVKAYKYVLIESDSMSIEKQIDTYKLLNLPISTLTTSGKKSVHALVKVDAENYEEYKERVRTIFNACKESGMEIDSQNRNPSRLTRLPGCERGDQMQTLIGMNIGAKDFQDWTENLQIDTFPDYIDLKDFINEKIEMPPEIIRGIMRKGDKLVLTGPSKAGKSWALIQLAVACATGGWWMGRIKCAKMRVVYINLELTSASSKNRIQTVWKEMRHANKEGLENLKIWNLRGSIITIQALVDTLIRRAKSMANPPDLYIVDPIYKINAGDENSAKDMNELLLQFDRLCKETLASLAYSHHHAKGSQFGKRALDRGSGSGVIGRDADAAIDLDFLYVPGEIRKRKADETEDSTWLKATGLHVEMTLRDFENKKPFNVWFKYPLHVFDGDDRFQNLKGEAEKNNFDKAEDGKVEKKNATDERIKRAIDELIGEDGLAQMKDIEDATDLTRQRIKQFIDASDEYQRNQKGQVTRCN